MKSWVPCDRRERDEKKVDVHMGGERGREEREERGEGGGISYSVRDEHVSPKSQEG